MRKEKDLMTLILYRQNLIDSIKMLDCLIKLNHEDTSEEYIENMIEQGRAAFFKLSKLQGLAVLY